MRLTVKDALEVDNRAYTVVGTTRKAQVLAITAGNRYLTDTLKTPSAIERADVTIVTPEEAKNEAVVRDLKGGRYDLVIYDGVKPDSPPEANALYFGVFPPGPAYAKPKEVQQPVILDWDIAHPLMQYVRDLSLVYVAKASVVELPAGAKSLIDSNQGSLAFIVPREGYTDTVVTFPLDGRHDAQHDLVSLHQLPALHLEQHSGAGQRPRGSRRRGGRARPAGRPARRDHRANDQGHLRRRTGRRDRRSVPPGNVRLQPGGQDRRLPGALGAQAACCRSRSTCSTPARATWPRAASSPRASPTSHGRILQDQDRLQPRHRHPEAGGRPEGHLVVARLVGPGRPARRVVYL